MISKSHNPAPAWVAMLVTAVLCHPAYAQSPGDIRSTGESARVFAEFERAGIPAAAKVRGVYHGQESFGSFLVSEDTLALARASDVVVIGTAGHGTSRLSSDQRAIYTEFQFRLERVFKGEHRLRRGDDILLTIPGGRIIFPDGTRAEISLATATGEPPIKEGRRYLLFLELLSTEADVAVSGGRLGSFAVANDEGVFEIVESPRRVVAYHAHLPVSQEFQTLGSVDKILERVQNAAEKSIGFPDVRRLP